MALWFKQIKIVQIIKTSKEINIKDNKIICPKLLTKKIVYLKISCYGN